jgi:hypothetical protein
VKTIIYGAGRIGRQLFSALKNINGHEIQFFWDKYWDAENREPIGGVPVRKPEPQSIPPEERGELSVFVTITAKDVSRQIGDELAYLGYKVVHDRETINQLIYDACESEVSKGSFEFNLRTCHACPVSKENDGASCNIFNDRLMKELAAGADDLEQKRDRLVIPKLGVLIGNKCNLSCEGCNHLVDTYPQGGGAFLESESVLSDVSKIAKAADLIQKVVVVGGEAFLHPNLHSILTGLLAIPKVGFIEIITNGSIIPKDSRLFELMAHKRVMVEVSGYGGLRERLAAQVGAFLSKLREHGVSHHFLNTLQWFDFGDFSLRNYSGEEHGKVYGTCCSVSNDIWDGKLYKCSRSAFGTHLGYLPVYPGDYLDLRSVPDEELRERLSRFFANSRPLACLHCNGASIVMEAGVQVPLTRLKVLN